MMTTVAKQKRLKMIHTNRQPTRAPSMSFSNTTTTMHIPQPTKDQIRIFAFSNALPMIVFGFTDQTVMIHAGNAIDCSIGVTFGLSTLTAAAVGQVCSNGTGILFGGIIGNLVKAAGLPSSNLTSLQRTLPIITRTRIGAQLAGVFLGCTLGLCNLLLIDTDRSSSLKLKNNKNLMDDGKMEVISRGEGGIELDFEIEASNDLREDATTFVVRGPNTDGLLANMTSALSANGCSHLELSAVNAASSNKDVGGGITDVFVVVNQETNEQLSNIEMKEMAQILMDTTKLRHIDHKARIEELEERNLSLKRRIQRLETVSASHSQGVEKQ